MTATPCVLASAMRGTLMASVIVAKERTPSVSLLAGCSKNSRGQSKLTNCSNDLGLQTKLVLEASGKVADATLAISGHVWDLSDMVEHVSTGKEKNSNQANGSPQISVLEKRRKVWCGNSEEGDKSENSGRDSYRFHVVKWSGNRRFLALGK